MWFIIHTKNNQKFVNLKVMFLKEYFLKYDMCIIFKVQKRFLNALNVIYCKFKVPQIILMEDIGKIVKGR